jgi:hypothetical protein
MKSAKPMPMIKPNKPFSTEDEMYGKKMGQMPKPMPQPQKGMGKKMAPMPKKKAPGFFEGFKDVPKKSPSKRGALMKRLKGMGK